MNPAPGTNPAPYDRQFDDWSERGLVWLPEVGMGKLRTEGFPYDEGYFSKYAGYAATQQGRAITAARLELVEKYERGLVVDVGIGCGDFIERRRERGYPTLGYDVNQAGVRWLHERGLWCNLPTTDSVRSMSLWDALEHVAEPAALLKKVERHVFVSLPCVPGVGPPSPSWKHLRRDEHAWYWTHDGFVRWMAAQGFAVLSSSSIECELGREDIGTFAFLRIRRP